MAEYELRPYQSECIEAIEGAGAGRWLVQMATGLGKTVTFASIPRHGRTLILSHREELVSQPVKYFDCTVGIERAKERSNGEEVISASVQSLVKRLGRFDRDAFHTIIVDEAHHAVAPTYRKIIGYFEAHRVLGFTATPNRFDKKGLGDVFQEIIFERDLPWESANTLQLKSYTYLNDLK